ncbi:MAG: hypothetical protein J6B23_05190, partial [Clostridia bacterium]|nr:hypothetical protein [Clostridia bacterium]
MKKLLAIILAVILVMPTFAVWATDTAVTTVTEEYGADVAVAEYNAEDTYEIGTAYTRKFENVTSYHVKTTLTEEIGTSESGYAINSGNKLFIKIPLPVIPKNQSYENFYFNYTTAKLYYDTEKLIKLPGDDWVFDETTTLKDEKISAALDAAVIANDSAVTVEPINASADTHYRARADVTSYANECRYAGQDYMYIIIKNSSTKKVYSNVAHYKYPSEVMTIAFSTTDKFTEEYAA